jgi:hypothetical protein
MDLALCPAKARPVPVARGGGLGYHFQSRLQELMRAMPNRRTPLLPIAAPADKPRGSFRQRYDQLETRRAELMNRLRTLGDGAQRHPGYKRALKLLNDTFRKSKLAQRLAVLQAAAWLIDILEKLTTSL